jgi:hypothetical protein
VPEGVDADKGKSSSFEELFVASKIESITFDPGPPLVGAVTVEETKMDMSMKMEMVMLGSPKQLSSLERRHEERRVTVLAAGKDKVTKAQIAYGIFDKTSTQGGKEQAQRAPISGKTYQVEDRDGLLFFTDSSGDPPKQSEAMALKADVMSLNLEGLGRDLPREPLRIGQVLELSEGAVRELLGEDPSMTFIKPSFKLEAVRAAESGFNGLFSLSTTIQVKPGPGMSMSMDVSGRVELTQRGHLRNFRLAGPIKVVMDEEFKGKMKVEGKGEIDISKTIEPRAQP